MSRLRFKGGAWTNSEDEVLLASLTVYGLKNWERVASMLVRKTAAQCRERWENFLDPHLNIREAWTVGEEEQLVQLQALFPNQWTLIAQEIWHRCGMKRPAWLCEEHYHLLLDALEYERHQQTDGSKSALTLEDFLEERKRQRSVHQGHETRAARPDAVNAEVFEREMVEFAVSRLANQDGKKGLRKERKKQLEHTSFLAKLQSNREAIESGTLSAKARKRMEKAMMEDRQGPSGSRLLDSIAEESEEGVEDSGKEHSGNFQPINLGADKEAAGIETKQRTLVKRFKSTPSLDPVQSQLQDAKSVGIDLELLRAAGSVSSTVKKSLGPPNDLSLLTAGGDASVNDHQIWTLTASSLSCQRRWVNPGDRMQRQSHPSLICLAPSPPLAFITWRRTTPCPLKRRKSRCCHRPKRRRMSRLQKKVTDDLMTQYSVRQKSV
ncbi:hypothetical protein TRVL_01503 [Trypanosoma vivax]|nr:hypothetical protein TRVL_01503 [Trypanosoma vivax]